MQALGLVLAHELVRFNTRQHCSKPPVHGGLAVWQRRKAIDYIDEHLAESVSLATLAQLACLSPSYFCRAFRQSFGIPPQRYKSTQRIERAKVLLAQPGSSVTDVGLTLGFSDTSVFSTTFRRIAGLTPNAYRRSFREA